MSSIHRDPRPERSVGLLRACSLVLVLGIVGGACGSEEPPAPTPASSAPGPSAAPGQPAASAPQAKPSAPMATKLTPQQQRLRSIAAIPSKAKHPDQALTELRPWLNNDDRDVREAALLALWDIETESANEALAQVAARDADPDIKSYAVEELVDREASQALPALTRLLSDSDADLREQAAEGLETLDDRGASSALLKAIETEKDEWVRDAILSALSSLDPDFDEEPYELD